MLSGVLKDEAGLRTLFFGVFYAKTNEANAKVTFEASPKSVRSPDHKIIPKKGEYYEGDLLIPWSNISATYTVGGVSKNGAGKAQLDHSRSNTLLPKVATGWYRFRGFNGEKPIMFQVRITPAGAKKGWYLQSDGTPQSIGGSKITISKSAGKPTLKVQLPDGMLEVDVDSTLYVYKPTEAYGALGSLAKPWVGNPVTTTYRASGTNSGVPVKGTLEVSTLK